MRIRDPKTTALIFASGKMVVTGAKSEDDSKLASRKYARIIQKLGFNAKFTDFKIQNIVGSCDIKFPIRLEGLASRHHHFSSYEPELFPGLIYRMIKPKIVLLIFVSGKIVLTGAKVREEIYEAFEMIYPVLQGWQSPSVPIPGISNSVRLPQELRLSCPFGPSNRPGSTVKSKAFTYIRLYHYIGLSRHGVTTFCTSLQQHINFSLSAFAKDVRIAGALCFRIPRCLAFSWREWSCLYRHMAGNHRGQLM